MSRDFEDTLRDLLVDAADAQTEAYLEPDAGEVLVRGRRVVRRRRVAMLGGTAAAAVVLGIGTWAALDGSTPRAEQVPATRSGAAATDIAPDVVTTTLAVEGNPRVASYTVRLDRSTGAVTVTETSARGEEGLDVAIGEIPAGEQTAVWGVLSRDPSLVVVGVLPSDAEQLMGRFVEGDIGGVTTRTAPLGTTSYQAFLFQSEKPSPGADLGGLAWSTGRGVYTADGAELPSAAFGNGRLVYVDAAGGELGLVTAEGSARVPLEDNAGGAPLGHLTTAVKEAGKPTVTTFATVLPVDAGDIAVQVAPGTTLVAHEERPLLGGSGVAVIATVRGPDAVTPAVSGLSWTAGGRQVTWPNPD
jgi:hypothetical protein